MKLSLAIISTSYLVAIAQAASIKFNVIAPGATDVKVSVNGAQVALTAADPNVPYFTGSAESGEAKDYKVIQKEITFFMIRHQLIFFLINLFCSTLLAVLKKHSLVLSITLKLLPSTISMTVPSPTPTFPSYLILLSKT